MKIYREEAEGGILYDTESLSYRFLSHPPDYPVRTIALHSEPQRRDILRAPVRIYLELTRRCNLTCRHCFASSSPKAPSSPGIPEEMPLDRVLRLLDDMKNSGVINVRFTGGEPTAHPRWFDILSHARKIGLVIALNTNGVFPDAAETVARIAKLEPEQVTLSLDGPRDVHDFLRGRGMYDRVIETLRSLKNVVPHLRLTCVLTNLNKDSIPAMVDVASRFVNVINFVFLRPFGRGKRKRGLMLTYDEHCETARVVSELQKSAEDLLIIHSDLPLPNLFRQPEEEKTTFSPGSLDFSGTHLFIAACGAVYPHHYFEYLPGSPGLGRFPNERIEDIWQKSPSLDAFRDWKRRTSQFCRECGEFSTRCSGPNLEMEIARITGRISNNPYCIKNIPDPPWRIGDHASDRRVGGVL